jgi:hypothetical protein
VGVGDPLEASYELAGPLRAGSWNLIGDGVPLHSVDIVFDVIWRRGGSDRTIVTFTHHFAPTPGRFDAEPFEGNATSDAVEAAQGDLLVLRMTASSSVAGAAYLPNADGQHANGRIPSIILP